MMEIPAHRFGHWTMEQLADDRRIQGGPLDAPLGDAQLHKMDRGDYAPEFPAGMGVEDVDLAY